MKNHITKKEGFIHFYLSSPRFEVWGNYPAIGEDEPAYLCACGEDGVKNILACGCYVLRTNPQDENDEWYEPQVQGMNAKDVARFVHLFNLLFVNRKEV